MNRYTSYNEGIFKIWKEKFNFYWMVPISHNDFLNAKNGKELLTVTPNKKVPFKWYSNCKGKKVLGIAAGGGQQMPIFAALGADCTLLDISYPQLSADEEVSKRENYKIHLIKGDMAETLPFSDDSFDIVINPVSNHYIDDIDSLFKEIYRVLKPNGVFIAGMENEIYWTTNPHTHRMQYSLPINPLKDKKLAKQLQKKEFAFQFSHTTSEQLNGQLKAGFIIKDVYEDTEDGFFSDHNIPTFLATLSIKQKNTGENNSNINNKRNVPLKGYQIMHLRSEILGFKEEFYNFRKLLTEQKNMSQEIDIITTTAVKGCFTIELLLKYLYSLYAYDNSNDSSSHPYGHNLGELYSEVRKINNSLCQELEERFSKSKYHYKNCLCSFLKSINNGFENWRYSYSKGQLGFNLNTTSDVINILLNESERKYLDICDSIKISNKNEIQFLSYANLEDIKPNKDL